MTTGFSILLVAVASCLPITYRLRSENTLGFNVCKKKHAFEVFFCPQHGCLRYPRRSPNTYARSVDNNFEGIEVLCMLWDEFEQITTRHSAPNRIDG